MSRFYSESGDSSGSIIDRDAVAQFFDERAVKISSVGPLQAVIYQDKNAELARRRDIAEKAKLLPLLALDGSQRILDVGCGTGRWANDLVPAGAWYHGIDACKGLVDYARECFSGVSSCRFTVAAADDFSLESLGESLAFDRVVCAGVLMYLNDEEACHAVHCMVRAVAPGGMIMFREPMGLGRRLTISGHYSEEMEQDYSAIYRTYDELKSLIRLEMPETAFHLVDSGCVYDDPALNNRGDTRQQWLLLERKI